MDRDDYCDIFCAHLMRPRLHRQIADYTRLVTLDNGDGLGFGRIDRYHDILMNTDSIIFHFDYIPFGSARNSRSFVVVGFRLVITIHQVDDLDIEDDCL